MRDLINIVVEGDVVPFRKIEKAPKGPNPMYVNPDTLHPDAAAILHGGGLDARDADMERNIGRIIRFKPEKPGENIGYIKRTEPHKIIGIQRDYRGELCYRVQPHPVENFGHAGKFGSPARPEDIIFVDGGEVTSIHKD